MTLCWRTGGRAFALCFVAGAAMAEVPVADDFAVNTYTTSNQLGADVGVGPNGDFVIVFNGSGSLQNDNSGTSAQARRYASDGSPMGSEFQVNTFTTQTQTDPVVSVDTNGGFVVLWEGYGDGDQFQGIHGQRFDSTGGFVSNEFLVNSYTTSLQQAASVAGGSNGFVVVWHSNGSAGDDSSNNSVQGQRFDSSGAFLGSEFQVNSYTSGQQRVPAVAMASTGEFVAVWQSADGPGTDFDTRIEAQRFDSSGNFLGGEFQVNSYTTSFQYNPAVAIGSDGGFLVVWESNGSSGDDSDNRSVQGQRFDSGGSVLGSQFQVNASTTGFQQAPSVTVTPADYFVVTWDSQPGTFRDIMGQWIAPDGARVGAEFLVNSYTTHNQTQSAISAGPALDGEFVVVWEGYRDTDQFFGVQGRMFVGDPSFFRDGFESGDTTGWSSSVP